MLERWVSTTPETLGLIALSAATMYAAILALTRLTGLRSFAQMSAFDFAMSVAVGSLLASTIISGSISLFEGAFGLGCLFLLQATIGLARERSSRVSNLVDNQPMLLMDGSEVLHENLAAARITSTDLLSKLRAANVSDFDEVHAVILETTGDVSVIHGKTGEFDRSLLKGVVDRHGRAIN